MGKKKSHSIGGYSLSELMITLAIVGVMGSVFIGTMASLRSRDNIDRAAQSIFDDLVFIRSRAVSTNRNHRLEFTSRTSWRLQAFNEGSGMWETISDSRNMPLNTELTVDSFLNAGDNLSATPRGLFEFEVGTDGEPYVTVEGQDTRKKAIYVAVGGAVDARNE